MHFRIPRGLDGFEAAAVTGDIVSQQAFGTTGAADVSSLQTLLRRPQAAHKDHNAAWSQTATADVFRILCKVSESGWPSAALLRALARFLSGASASLTQIAHGQVEGSNHIYVYGEMPAEAAVGLTIFFTCQMLHQTEVGHVLGILGQFYCSCPCPSHETSPSLVAVQPD